MWFSMLVRGLLPLKVKHCFVKQDASIQGNSITATQGYEDPIMGTVVGGPKASGYRQSLESSTPNQGMSQERPGQAATPANKICKERDPICKVIGRLGVRGQAQFHILRAMANG